MQIASQTTIAELATEFPATIRIFQRHGIDFCCGGKRALGEVCAERNLSLEALATELAAALRTEDREETVRWTGTTLEALIAHILARFHRPLDEDLPRLGQMAQKVLAVHGERHPEMADVVRTFVAIREDIEPHMMKEERVLFPYVRRIEALASGGAPLLASPFGSIESPIRVMELEHESVGRLLADLRRHTGGYAVPADGCATYRGLMHGLAELERDTHEHIHLENNVLFPGAKALEDRLLTAQPVGASVRRSE